MSDNELDRLEPATRSILRSIRANLKVAIQFGLSSSQTDLIASYLQVIIMCATSRTTVLNCADASAHLRSEGDKFIHAATNKVALALRAGPAGKPVASASAVLAKWISRELKEQEVASVGEYVANATSDLVLLGLWNVATDAVAGETIPTYYFARDDRITKCAPSSRPPPCLQLKKGRRLQGPGRATRRPQEVWRVQETLETRPEPARGVGRDHAEAECWRPRTSRDAEEGSGRGVAGLADGTYLRCLYSLTNNLRSSSSSGEDCGQQRRLTPDPTPQCAPGMTFYFERGLF